MLCTLCQCYCLLMINIGGKMMENVQCGMEKNAQESNTAYKAGYKHG